jgi:methionyl-tRNA synthetase
MAAIEITQIILLILAVLWTLPWKGTALWKSAKSNQKIWFVVFLIINTLGLLEILYLIFWQKRAKKR